MIVILVTLSILTVSLSLWHFGRKPAIHRHLTDEKLETLLTVLLNQGHDGGVLFIQGRKPLPFVQVVKYAGPSRTGLQFDFPKAPWATPYLQEVDLAVRRSDLRPLAGPNSGPDGLEFITLDFGTNVRQAAASVKSIAEDALGLRLTTDGRAYFQNVSSDPHAHIGFELK
jgi:hypothetical protein